MTVWRTRRTLTSAIERMTTDSASQRPRLVCLCGSLVVSLAFLVAVSLFPDWDSIETVPQGEIRRAARTIGFRNLAGRNHRLDRRLIIPRARHGLTRSEFARTVRRRLRGARRAASKPCSSSRCRPFVRRIENASPMLGNVAHQVTPAICNKSCFEFGDAPRQSLILSGRDRAQVLRQGRDAFGLSCERRAPPRNLGV